MADRVNVPDRDRRRSLFERKGDFGLRELGSRHVARNAIAHALAPASSQDGNARSARGSAEARPLGKRPPPQPTAEIAATPSAPSTPAAPRRASPPAPLQTQSDTPAQAPRPAAVTGAADLGAFIRARRTQRGLTQQQLADLAGLGRRFVSELESGKATLEFDRVVQCCAALGIDLIAQSRS